MPGSVRYYPDPRPEATIRKRLWFWWSVSIAAMVWFVWYATQATSSPMYLWTPILFTALGVLAGWFFGYKLGMLPLLTGYYIFAKKSEK